MTFRQFLFGLTLGLLISASASGQKIMPYDQQVHNFGHVGIDFKLFYTFFFVNDLDRPLTITHVEVSCDCSTVSCSDTLLQIGDTAFFDLNFSTADYYGPTNKSITVTTDHPLLPEFQFFYLATIGQWFNGLKPEPISLFFLPNATGKTVLIPNTSYDNITIQKTNDIQDICAVTIEKSSADRGDKLSLRVLPQSTLPKGTTYSTLSITVSKSGESEVTILTIPIKIVKY